MKKNFTILTIMAMAFIMPFTINANTWNGSTDTEWRSAGTNAYYIDTAEELAGLASKVNSGTNYSGYTFYLTANLDLNGSSHNWDPIGYFNGIPGGAIKSSKNYFSGTFNGQGYTISNYSASYNAGSGTGKITVGLFGAIRSASIKNITVTDSYVYVKSNAYYIYGGAIAGWMDNGSVIDNCGSYNNNINVNAPFQVLVKYGNANAGGICGSAENSTAQNCSVYGNSITADGSKSDNNAAISNNYSGSDLTSNNTEFSSAADMTAGIAQKAQAQNEQIHKWNNWGAGTKPTTGNDGTYFYLLDETTGAPTNKIYLAVNLKAADASSISKEANVTVNSSDKIAFTYEGASYDLYPKGSTVSAEFYPLGYSGDWNDHGNYVAWGESTAIVNNTDVYENSRYERKQTATQTLNAPMLSAYSVTTTAPSAAEDMTQKVAAINRSTIIYNNFGADAVGAAEPKTPYFIDEQTWKPTDKIYYAYTGITNAENVTAEVASTTEAFICDGVDYVLYYAGQNIDVNIKYTLPGYKGDWTDHGCYVAKTLLNDAECTIASTTISNNISEEGYNGERYARTQEESFSIVMPNAPASFSYTTATTHAKAENVAQKVAAINRATIIYNNFGADAEGAAVPKTPYFIDEATFMPTDKIYYTYSSITDLENITSDVTVVTEGFNYTGIESTLYYAGQELDFTVKFGLPGYKGDWTDHGCYIAQAFVNGTECDITGTTVSNSISEEGYNGERYARTQEVAFKATMPGAPITLSYATSDTHEQAEDVSEAVKAINNATIEYNNWGVGEAPKTPYFIDETTLKPTDKIYYAVTFYDDRDNILQVPSLQVSEQAKVYTYQDTEYTLYPTGSEVTIDTYPIGYSADWSSKGYYLNTVYSMSNSAELPIAASNVNDDLQNITDGNYHRTHTATVKLPETSNGTITLYCSVAETAPENAVFNDITEDVTNINNATIIYNNWGVGEEPATPYYIEQNGNSFVKSDKIYYAFEPAVLNPEGNRETTGVRSEAEYVHTENKKTFTYNETEYPLYANGDVVGIKCYLDGFTMEMEDNNEGWKVAQVNENNANAWEISEDPEYAEIIADITNEEGFDNETERFCREHTVFITVPLVTEMRRQPISLTYTTAGKIKDDTATSIEDITGDATYAHGVITSDGIIEVYNINGILVARKKNQVNMAELNSGIYLVRCGNKTMKIVR